MGAEDIAGNFNTLSEDERRAAVAMMRIPPPGIPPPTGGGLTVVWIMVLTILGLVAVGGMVLTFILIRDDAAAEAIVGFTGAALGAVVGLIAPSPSGGNGNSR
jgi:hypothetical protein